MQRFIFRSPAVIILLGLTCLIICNSCCTKKYCLGADDLNFIRFYGFVQEELDTIIIQKFEKNTNFQVIIDTVVEMPEYINNQNENILIHFSENFDVNYDYILGLNSLSGEYTVSAFVIGKEKCNKGFLCFDYYNALVSYKINNKEKTAGYLIIEK